MCVCVCACVELMSVCVVTLLLCATCHLSRSLMGLLPSANVPRASCPVLRTDCSKLRLPARPVVLQQRKSSRAPRKGRRGCVPTRWGGCPPVFPPYVSAHSGPAGSRNTIRLLGVPPSMGPNLGPVLRKHWKTLCFSTFFDGWKGAKCGNLLNSEALLIPI